MHSTVDFDKTLTAELPKALAKALEPVARLQALRNKLSLTTKELSELTGVNKTTLGIWRTQSRGPEYVKDGNIVLYPMESVNAWLKARRVRTHA